MNNILFLLSLIIVISSCQKESHSIGDDYSLSELIQPIPYKNTLKDSSWNIWCGSMVKGYDGKYHLYYSRWPRQCGHEGWISHSEIAYATANNPEGPYHFVNVALPSRGKQFWDGAMTHNPYIIRKNNKYYLYYIGTKGNILSPDQKVDNKEWWARRNTQRIGVAVADHPQGPWKRLDDPILSVSNDSTAFDALCVNNPAVCIGRNDKIVMLYKAVCKNGTIEGGNVRFSVAFSDNPTGPFTKTQQLIFQPKNNTDRMVAEDPFIWFDKKRNKYYAIVRDVVGQFTGEDSGGLALLQSNDAIHWSKVKKPKVLPAILQWEDGTSYNAKKDHVERPFLFFDEKGNPALLFGAFSVHNNGVFREHSFNGFIPLSGNKKYY